MQRHVTMGTILVVLNKEHSNQHTSFFSGEPKSIKRGENHYKSDHIESFQYSNGMIRGHGK